MHVFIDSCLRIPQAALPSRLRSDLQAMLTRANPDRAKAEKSGHSVRNIPAMVHFFWTDDSGNFCIPRGAIGLLRERSAKHGVSLLWKSKVVKRSEKRVPINDLALPLRDYQKEAVTNMLRLRQGYVRAPCGAGKTVMGASAIVASGEPALVIVHTHDLLLQWVKLFRSWEYSVRVIAGGKLRGLRTPLRIRNGVPEIAVATVQTLHSAGEKADTLLNSCGAVLLDEAHHAPASTFSEVIQRCPARFRWGVSATPNREDGWSFALQLVLGEEIFGIGMQELVANGFLMKPTVIRVNSGAKVDIEKNTVRGQIQIARCINDLAEDANRNNLLIKMSWLLAMRGRTVLLLVPRVEQAHTLAAKISTGFVTAIAVTSKVGKGLRQQRIEQVRNGQIQVLVATQLADEGLDIPNLDALIVASTGRAAGRAIQRLGRVMRVSEGKNKPIVIDVVDPVPFKSQSSARSMTYMRELSIIAPEPIDYDSALDGVKLLV